MQYWETVVHGEGCVRVELGEEDGDRAVTSTCGHLWWLRCPATAAVRLGMEESRSCCLSLLWLLRPVATNRWLQTSLLFIAFKARAQGPGVGGATLSGGSRGDPSSSSWSVAVPVVPDIPDCKLIPPPSSSRGLSLCLLFE